ncbi:MAG TPA: hypothetical protein PLP33_25390 [Leptospiraceae bacterium]|nr:hypothetical protein [Leptospiraceae bacterium]
MTWWEWTKQKIKNFFSGLLEFTVGVLDAIGDFFIFEFIWNIVSGIFHTIGEFFSNTDIDT